MRTPPIRVLRALFFLGLCLSLCHCGGMAPGGIRFESDDSLTPAERRLQEVLSQNAGVEAVKGVGRVKLTQNNQTSAFRAYWTGKAPDRFRIEVRAATGQPIVSLATDGKLLYLLSYSDNRLFRKKASDNVLNRIVSIKIGAADFLDLLSGRIPVHQDGNVRLEVRAGKGDLLVVEGRGREYVESIGLDDVGRVCEFERRDRRGNLLFRVSFTDFMETGGYRLPKSILLTNDEGAAVDIAVERSWINPEIDEGTFVLKSL